MFGSLGMTEVVLIAGVLLVLFGPKQIPKLGRAIGQTIREARGIRDEISGAADEAREAVEDIEEEVRETVGTPKKRGVRRTRS